MLTRVPKELLRDGGLLYADGDVGQVEVVAGSIRQNPADRTRWDYIADANHTPTGVSGAYATASGSTINIGFAKTYSRVISFVAGPDETLANALGFSCGASVGLSNAGIRASIDTTLAGFAYYDGSDWVVAGGTGQSGGGAFPSVSVAHSAGNITVSHSYLPGVDVSVTPFTVNGSVVPKLPMIRTTPTNTSFVVQMQDLSSQTLDTTADTSWAFMFRKSWMGGIHLDGVSSYDWPLDLGNIWFMGLFEV
mgnify:CR=1 FL=1